MDQKSQPDVRSDSKQPDSNSAWTPQQASSSTEACPPPYSDTSDLFSRDVIDLNLPALHAIRTAIAHKERRTMRDHTSAQAMVDGAWEKFKTYKTQFLVHDIHDTDLEQGGEGNTALILLVAYAIAFRNTPRPVEIQFCQEQQLEKFTIYCAQNKYIRDETQESNDLRHYIKDSIPQQSYGLNNSVPEVRAAKVSLNQAIYELDRVRGGNSYKIQRAEEKVSQARTRLRLVEMSSTPLGQLIKVEVHTHVNALINAQETRQAVFTEFIMQHVDAIYAEHYGHPPKKMKRRAKAEALGLGELMEKSGDDSNPTLRTSPDVGSVMKQTLDMLAGETDLSELRRLGEPIPRISLVILTTGIDTIPNQAVAREAIKSASKKLKAFPDGQFGIQLVQIGKHIDGTRFLQELDDKTGRKGGLFKQELRDITDTTFYNPYTMNKSNPRKTEMAASFIYKSLLGAIIPAVDQGVTLKAPSVRDRLSLRLG